MLSEPPTPRERFAQIAGFGGGAFRNNVPGGRSSHQSPARGWNSHLMAEAWPPSVGARVRPVETAQVAFSPEGEPVSLQGEGPTPLWARLRWPLPSDGDDRREALVSDVEEGVPEIGGSAITSHARASRQR